MACAQARVVVKTQRGHAVPVVTQQDLGAGGETEAPRHELTGEAMGCHSPECTLGILQCSEEAVVPRPARGAHFPRSPAGLPALRQPGCAAARCSLG